jgi:hypothetical protein
LTPQKKKAIDDAMNWLRNNDPGRRGRDPTAQGLANLAGATHARPSVSEEASGSVNWLRNNDVKPEDVNEPTLTVLTNSGEPLAKGTGT